MTLEKLDEVEPRVNPMAILKAEDFQIDSTEKTILARMVAGDPIEAIAQSIGQDRENTVVRYLLLVNRFQAHIAAIKLRQQMAEQKYKGMIDFWTSAVVFSGLPGIVWLGTWLSDWSDAYIAMGIQGVLLVISSLVLIWIRATKTDIIAETIESEREKDLGVGP